jgi:hypothetical protein
MRGRGNEREASRLPSNQRMEHLFRSSDLDFYALVISNFAHARHRFAAVCVLPSDVCSDQPRRSHTSSTQAMSLTRPEDGEREPLLLQQQTCSNVADPVVTRGTRITALALLFLLSTGANWTEACLGPLKTTLLHELAIDNTQYGVIFASTQLANTLLPIFAGVWIDRVGASKMAIVATSIVCVGAVLAAVASSTASYPMLVSGRVIQGLGIIIVDTAATKLIVRWSRGAGWLGLSISCNFAFDRAAGAISKATAVPIAQSGGSQLSCQVSPSLLLSSTLALRNVTLSSYAGEPPPIAIHLPLQCSRIQSPLCPFSLST